MHLFNSFMPITAMIFGSLVQSSSAESAATVFHQDPNPMTYAINDTAPLCPGRNISFEAQHAIFFAFIDATYSRKEVRAAYDKHVSEDYIQHNPWMTSGRDATVAVLEPIFAVADLQVQHVGFLENGEERGSGDGGIGVVHYRLKMPDPAAPMAVMRMFRMDGTCIVEHWDVMQEIPANKTNPLPMV